MAALDRISPERQQLYADKLQHICIESSTACNVYSNLTLPRVTSIDLRDMPSRWDRDSTYSYLDVVNKLRTQLETVWIRGKYGLELYAALQKCPNLQHLLVGDAEKTVTPNQLLLFVKSCRGLSSLHISEWPSCSHHYLDAQSLAFYLRCSTPPCTLYLVETEEDVLYKALTMDLDDGDCDPTDTAMTGVVALDVDTEGNVFTP